jgi:ferric-dicitrate binding protein FerR (iron transport regulator)
MKKEQQHIDDALLLRIIEEKADDNDRRLFKRWIEAADINAENFEQLKKLHQLCFVDVLNKQQNWESVQRKLNGKRPLPDYIELADEQHTAISIRMRTFIRYAAMFLLILGVSFMLKFFVFDSQQLTVYGKNLNPHQPYILADGSKVYLNGNSEISFSKKFGKNDRNISLKGEAFFEVQRNEKIPFSISTLKTTTQVLGTSFDVYSDLSGKVKVTVVTGVVSFYAGKKENGIKLTAGEQGSFNPRLEKIEKDQNPDRNFLSWKTGILYFNETPLTDAFALLQKQYAKVFIFDADQTSIPKLTTTIDNQSLNAVLDELNLLLTTKNVCRNDTIFFQPIIK